jgi:transposase
VQTRELLVDRTLSKRRSTRSSLLSCPMPAGGSTAGSLCCRLAVSHQPTRRTSRYPTDVTDTQCAELDPLLPDPACLAGRGGRWEKHCRRVMVDAILYVVDNGIKWRALPADFPPWPTVYKRFAAWEKVGASQRLLDALRDRVRLAEGRVSAPSAAVVDSQSVRAAETVGRTTRGWDGGKRIAGRKRHIVVDTMGLLLAVLVTPASTQDRVAARSLLRRMRDMQEDGSRWCGPTAPTPEPCSAGPAPPSAWRWRLSNGPICRTSPCCPEDGWWNGPLLRSPDTAGVCDYERLRHHHEAIVRWSMIRITSRRLTQRQ